MLVNYLRSGGKNCTVSELMSAFRFEDKADLDTKMKRNRTKNINIKYNNLSLISDGLLTKIKSSEELKRPSYLPLIAKASRDCSVNYFLSIYKKMTCSICPATASLNKIMHQQRKENCTRRVMGFFSTLSWQCVTVLRIGGKFVRYHSYVFDTIC